MNDNELNRGQECKDHKCPNCFREITQKGYGLYVCPTEDCPVMVLYTKPTGDIIVGFSAGV